MLALIDDLKFDIKDTSFEKIRRTLSYNFSTNQRLGNFNSYQSNGRHEEHLEITGTLIAKSQRQLKDFEAMAANKQPVLFVTDGNVKTVLILSINEELSNFLNTGQFLKQTYTMTLQVVGDGYFFENKGINSYGLFKGNL